MQKPVTLSLVKLVHFDTQWNLYLVVTHSASQAPPSFSLLVVQKSSVNLVSFLT